MGKKKETNCRTAVKQIQEISSFHGGKLHLTFCFFSGEIPLGHTLSYSVGQRLAFLTNLKKDTRTRLARNRTVCGTRFSTPSRFMFVRFLRRVCYFFEKLSISPELQLYTWFYAKRCCERYVRNRTTVFFCLPSDDEYVTSGSLITSPMSISGSPLVALLVSRA